MDRIIYTAMTGAATAANRQSVLANNLANVTTNGFRAQLATYRAVPVSGDGATTRVFAVESTAGYSDVQGAPQRSGRALDAMAGKSGWFSVQALDGTESYTRNGHFDVSTEGNLVTGNGLPVLSNGGAPITIPTGAVVTIGNDGNVSAKVGTEPSNIVGRLKIVTPTANDPLVRGENGLFRTFSGQALDADDRIQLQVGSLEGSNVNAIETIVGMIQTARQFETQMKLLQGAESNDRTADKLLTMQG